MKNWKFTVAVLAAVMAIRSASAAEPAKSIMVEARVIKMKAVACDTLKLGDSLAKDGTRLLTANEFDTLLETIKSVPGVQMVAAPRVIAFDQQQAKVQAAEKHEFVTGVTVELDPTGATRMVPKVECRPVGLTMELTPRLSNDGQILLRLNVSDTRVSGNVPQIPVTSLITPVFEGGSQGVPVPFTQFLQQPAFGTENLQSTILLPAKHSMLMKLGSHIVESRTEFGPPVISNIPYMSRLFKSGHVTKETEHSFVLFSAVVLQDQPQAAVAQPVTTPPVATPPVLMQTKYDVALTKPTASKNHKAILVILLDQYEAAVKAGDTAKAQTIAAHCLELDPTYFEKR